MAAGYSVRIGGRDPMNLSDLTIALDAAKTAGVTLQQARIIIRAVYEVRMVCGYEVRQGWEMPKPIRPSMTPCVEFHGGDGHALFWWDDAWGGFPSFIKAWSKDGGEFDEDDDPLVSPDTGADYKGCLEAYAELGFRTP